MPLPEPGQEAPPDFATHPHYQHLFDTLVAGGQNREQASLLLANLWRQRANVDAPQQHGEPQPPEPQHDPVVLGPQQGQADQIAPEQPNQAQFPHEPQRPPQPPIRNHEGQQRGQHRDHQQGQDPHPPEPRVPPIYQEAPALPANDQDLFAPDTADKRGPQLPPIDLEAKSLTMSLQRPTTYAVEKFRKFEYVPLWYFSEQGCQAADRDKASNEDLWDVTKTSDNCLSLCTAATNRPSPNALTDEQLTWEQFMDASHLLGRWLIPAGWPEGYARVLSSFFWQIENHEDKSIPEGKETLLLYQSRTRKAWHEELKAGHFFNLAKLDEKKMNTYRKEIDAKHNAAVRKAVCTLNTHPELVTDNSLPLPPPRSPSLCHTACHSFLPMTGTLSEPALLLVPVHMLTPSCHRMAHAAGSSLLFVSILAFCAGFAFGIPPEPALLFVPVHAPTPCLSWYMLSESSLLFVSILAFRAGLAFGIPPEPALLLVPVHARTPPCHSWHMPFGSSLPAPRPWLCWRSPRRTLMQAQQAERGVNGPVIPA